MGYAFRRLGFIGTLKLILSTMEMKKLYAKYESLTKTKNHPPNKGHDKTRSVPFFVQVRKRTQLKRNFMVNYKKYSYKCRIEFSLKGFQLKKFLVNIFAVEI